MRINLIIVLLFTLLASCQENKMQLKLINKEVVCKGFSSDTIESFYNHSVFGNENQKFDYTNVVKFEVSNATDKKYLLFVKNFSLSDIYNVDILIEDEHGNVSKKNAPLIDPSYSCKLISVMEQDFDVKFEKKRILKKMGYNINSGNVNYYDQGVVISSGENYIFQSSLSLPFVVEDKVKNLRSPVYFKLNPEKKYTFRLRYKLKDDIEKILPKDVLSNYKENNVEIFKGEIMSQKIPIVFK